MAAPIKYRQTGKPQRRMKEVKGDLHLWGGEHEPNQIEGLFLGFAAGKFGPENNFKIRRENPDRVETWNAPAVLRQRLTDVPVGTFVQIEHTGWIETNSGQNAMDFKVMMEDTSAPND